MIPTRIQTHRRLWTGVCASGAPSRRSDSLGGGALTGVPVGSTRMAFSAGAALASARSAPAGLGEPPDAADSAAWQLSVGHVHHGWRGRQADRDLAFVAEHARRLGLPFFSRRRDARRHARTARLSPEAGARDARYAALAEMAKEAQALRIAT